MKKYSLVFGFIFAGLALSATAQEPPFTTTLERAAMMVKDRPATVKFYKDVLGYAEEQTGTDIRLPPNHPLGLSPDAVVSMTYMKSHDGAYVAIMGVETANMPTVARPTGSDNAYNDIILVHVVKGIAQVHTRAVAGGYTVLSPPTLSRSGRAMQMFLRDPNGIKIELNELLPEKK